MINTNTLNTDYLYIVLTEDEVKYFIQNKIYTNKDQTLSDKFIHLSTVDQLKHVLTKFYKNRTDIICLKLSYDSLKRWIKWEGTFEKFPHLYNDLQWSSVILMSKRLQLQNNISQIPVDLLY